MENPLEEPCLQVSNLSFLIVNQLVSDFLKHFLWKCSSVLLEGDMGRGPLKLCATKHENSGIVICTVYSALLTFKNNLVSLIY